MTCEHRCSSVGSSGPDANDRPARARKVTTMIKGDPTIDEWLNNLFSIALACDEFHRERVYAMAGVRRGEPFTQENVAQMAAAVGALDLDSHAVRVG